MSAVASCVTWRVLLAYEYTSIGDTAALVEWVQRTCTRFELCGRVIVASEGININVAAAVPADEGTCPGANGAHITMLSGVEAFIDALQQMQIDGVYPFARTDFKLDTVQCPANHPPFGDLVIKLGKEVVSSGGMPASFVLGGTPYGFPFQFSLSERTLPLLSSPHHVRCKDSK